MQSNVRITDLLARYDVEDCLYTDGMSTTPSVDYGGANQTVARDRADAHSFIAECVGL